MRMCALGRSPDVQAGVYMSVDVGLLRDGCVSGWVSGSAGEAGTGDTRTQEEHVGHMRNGGGNLRTQEGHVGER